ncbi:MAG: hypothetical protein JNJ54_20475 [Myxococcaceae bacterium]|nr:hypothetical protein [Myxococcaceae bacterium]
MKLRLAIAAFVVTAGCSPVSTAPDGGPSAGGAAGGSAGGVAGGSAGGASAGGVAGGSAGGASAGGVAGGSAGGTSGGSGNRATLTGARAFTVAYNTSAASFTDAGQPFFLVMTLVDRGSGTACAPVIAPPVIGVQLTLQTLDGGALALGTHAISGPNYGKWEALIPNAQDTAYFSGGTATITRADTRSVGAFTTTLLHADGGTSTLSGTWDAELCRL